jgi:xanthine dehydrogenase iron-sulfur cluster and FAD-binding subunit A
VRLDGVTVRGCLVLAVQCAGSNVETIEGVSDAGEIADLQDAFVRRNALQCGFCTPGMLLAAQELLARCGMPSREEIRAHLSGNYCRCTGYQAIVDAIEAVARTRVGGEISDKEESTASPHPGSPAATRPSRSIAAWSLPFDEQPAGRPRSPGAP